ncbi:TPA: hypothetical protein ACXJST_000615 [Stenotrophomonas maltophilia]
MAKEKAIGPAASKQNSEQPRAPQDAAMRNERAFANFKDQIELLKVLSLGTGMCTASYVVAASELGSLTRAAGAITCITLGVWMGVCGVVVYFRNRLDLSGLSAWQKAWRVAQYLIVMCATLFAFSTAIELAKLKGSRNQPQAAAIELPATRHCDSLNQPGDAPGT